MKKFLVKRKEKRIIFFFALKKDLRTVLPPNCNQSIKEKIQRN